MLWFALVSIARAEDDDDGGEAEETIDPAALPAAVSAAIVAAYPAAHVDAALREGAQFEAEITVDGQQLGLTFDATGNLLETEKALSIADLPAPVRTALTEHYGKWTAGAAEIATKTGTPAVYEVVVSKGEHRQEVVFTAAGAVLRTEKLEDEEEDED